MPIHDAFFALLEETDLSSYATYEHAEAFDTLLRLLLETNEKMNLTAITEPREVILRHFADSLTVAPLIPQGARLIDVGCGGGFPCLPLAIVRRDLSITALDATAKKLSFVKSAAQALGLNLVTVAARAEEYTEGRERYDVAVSRAVARMNLLTELCLPLVKVGGCFLAMKGADGQAELAEAENGIALLGGKVTHTRAFTLADAGERFLIRVEKTNPTPIGYPRNWGRMKKKPLG